jgi:hypothetical protein
VYSHLLYLVLIAPKKKKETLHIITMTPCSRKTAIHSTKKQNNDREIQRQVEQACWDVACTYVKKNVCDEIETSMIVVTYDFYNTQFLSHHLLHIRKQYTGALLYSNFYE